MTPKGFIHALHDFKEIPNMAKQTQTPNQSSFYGENHAIRPLKTFFEHEQLDKPFEGFGKTEVLRTQFQASVIHKTEPFGTTGP